MTTCVKGISIETLILPSADLRPRDEKLPVLVYIHGGGYSTLGSNFYDAKILMDEDIVLVTINYRLGAFGFLQYTAGDIHGNMGLRDQRFALEWVNRNIGRFGGDKDRITLAGHSAGAAATEFHLLTEDSRDLFNQAIVVSGSALAPWAISKINHTRIIYRAYSKDKANAGEKIRPKSVKKWLMSVDAKRLINLTPGHTYSAGTSFKDFSITWAPVVEGLCVSCVSFNARAGLISS